MYISVSCVCLVPVEARRECQILWNCSYGQWLAAMWVLRTKFVNLGPGGEQPLLLTAEPSLQPIRPLKLMACSPVSALSAFRGLVYYASTHSRSWQGAGCPQVLIESPSPLACRDSEESLLCVETRSARSLGDLWKEPLFFPSGILKEAGICFSMAVRRSGLQRRFQALLRKESARWKHTACQCWAPGGPRV